MLDLPPPYTLIALAPPAEAVAHAVSVAAEAGAGTLVWVCREDAVEVAVVLEPGMARAALGPVLFAGMNAVAGALAVDSPVEKAVSFAGGRVLFDLREVGGVTVTWAAGEMPDWGVLGVSLDAAGLREEGFSDFETGGFVENFARHLMLALDLFTARGEAPVMAQYALRGVP